MGRLADLLNEAWFGTFIGLLGLVLGFIFYAKSQRRARLGYQYDEVTLLGGKDAAFPTEIEVRFNGIEVPQVTACRVFLWNSGQRTIRGEDIVARDPCRIQLESGTQVLKQTILRETRSVNGVRTDCSSQMPHVITITFDFLDPNDGFTLEVLHSGPRKELRVAGTIKGIPKGITNHGRALWFAARRHRGTPFPFNRPKLMFGITLLFGIGLALAGLFRPQIAAAFPALFKLPEPDRLTKPNWPFVLLGLFYASLPALLLWSRRRRYPSALEPPELEDEEPQEPRAAT